MKKNLDFDLKSYAKYFKRFGDKLQKYFVIIFIVTIVSLYGFLILQISSASQGEPSQTEISEQLGTVKRLKIDQQSIDKIIQLKDQNIAVQSLFESARENPFQE